MTTFDEISTDPQANRAYWTRWAQIYLGLARTTSGFPTSSFAKYYLKEFHVAMRNRANQTYLDTPKLCPGCGVEIPDDFLCCGNCPTMDEYGPEDGGCPWAD